MKKLNYSKGVLIAILMLPVIVSCQQNKESVAPASEVAAEAVQEPVKPFDPFMNREVFLRGEMNEYGKQAQYLLRKVKDDENKWCTLATLRSDWSPYRFKFADADWSSGTNFGYAMPPALLREGSAPLLLNPRSRFEEIRYEATKDGVYLFCIEYKDKEPYATVSYVEDAKLTSIGEFIKKELSKQE